jgi:hypothetical protein
MSDQMENQGPDNNEGGNTELEKLKANYENQLRGLNRANSLLKKELDEKTSAGKTVEERIASIEKERDRADRRAATMEAFGKHGLTEDFRSLFDIDDPDERAGTLKTLLDNHTKEAIKKTAADFLRDPESVPDGSSGRSYTVDQLKGMSPQDINKLWAAGRIKGSQKKR